MPSIAVIGASNSRTKFGNAAVRAYQARNYIVYPINPGEAVVEGIPAYSSILDVVHQIDVVSMYVPPDVGISLLEDIKNSNPGEIWLNPGSESPELLRKAEELELNVIIGCSILNIGESPGTYLEY